MLSKITDAVANFAAFTFLGAFAGLFIVGIFLPADDVDNAIIDWKADVAAKFQDIKFSPTDINCQ